MRVKVKQRHISKGVSGCPLKCPISLAIRYLFFMKKALVTYSRVKVSTLLGVPRYYFLPPDASAFIRAFDVGEQVEPFEFDLVSMDAVW